MEEYLLDRETLGKFVDELIKKKALPVNNEEELAQLREQNIRALDDKIAMAVFGQLTKEQNTELNQLLDQGEENPDVFNEFFQKAGIDLEQTMSDAVQRFSAEFLGGENV